jgi:hypothetical protein
VGRCYAQRQRNITVSSHNRWTLSTIQVEIMHKGHQWKQRQSLHPAKPWMTTEWWITTYAEEEHTHKVEDTKGSQCQSNFGKRNEGPSCSPHPGLCWNQAQLHPHLSIKI